MAREKAVSLSPPPSFTKFMPAVWTTWFNEIFDRIGGGPFKIKGYEVASLLASDPDPAKFASLDTDNPFSSIVFVIDESGGPCLAYSDGTDWRRVSDDIIVS